jgi:hypothetical protein
MTSIRPFALPLSIALAGLALAACQSSDAPWLTMPSPEEHGARFFPITSGSVHGQVTCNDCHGETGGFGAYDCLHCHTGAHANEVDVTALHVGVADFRWESAACLGCHRSGIGIDHRLVFPLPHSDATCATCHVQPGDRSVLGCAGCHDHEQARMDDKHRGEAGYAFESRACYRCHPRGVAGDD